MHRIGWFDRQVRADQYPNSGLLAKEFEISRRQAARDIEYMEMSLRAPLKYVAKYRGYCYEDGTFMLPYMFLPYFIFSVVYYIIMYVLNQREMTVTETLQHFGIQLLIGKTYAHLYFVFINVQFYLLFPFALWFLKNMPAMLKWCVPLGLAIQYAFVFLNKFYWQVTYPGPKTPLSSGNQMIMASSLC